MRRVDIPALCSFRMALNYSLLYIFTHICTLPLTFLVLILSMPFAQVPVSKKRVGLLFYESPDGAARPPPVREKCPVFSRLGTGGDQAVGVVSSGTPAPSLAMRNIAMAYVKPELAAVGTSLAIGVRSSVRLIWDKF